MKFIYPCQEANPTAMILLDLSAAFDPIDHSTLLSCLQTWFGVGGSVLKWFTSYLPECYQSIKVGSTLSDFLKLRFGVPKRSFIVFIVHYPLSLVICKYKRI